MSIQELSVPNETGTQTLEREDKTTEQELTSLIEQTRQAAGE